MFTPQMPAISFKINKYITLKLENNNTVIYFNGERYLNCMKLVLQIPRDKIPDFDEINSIDEASELYKLEFQDKIHKGKENVPITPIEVFWGHCSNLQAWVENDYDTRLLHSNLAFPLLRQLFETGDTIARRVFKEEIAKRIMSGHESVIIYLVKEHYLDLLNNEEINSLLDYLQASKDKEVQKYLILNGYVKNDQKKEQILRSLFLKLEKIQSEHFLYPSRWKAKKIFNIIWKLSYLSRKGIIDTPDDLNYTTLKFCCTGLTVLPPEIGDLWILKWLDFSNNYLEYLPKSIGNLKSLIRLNLSHNKLVSLPNSLWNLISLKELYLGSNILKEIPRTIGNFKSLRILDLSRNPINELPKTINNIKKLKSLNIAETKIITLPDEIFELKNLKEICVESRYFSNLDKLRKLLKPFENEKFDLYIEDHFYHDVVYYRHSFKSILLHDLFSGKFAGKKEFNSWKNI